MFYEKCERQRLRERREDAITMANAIVYGSPSYDTKSVRSKQRMWEQFIRSLDWEYIEKKSKKMTVGDFTKMISGTGAIPVRQREKKGDK